MTSDETAPQSTGDAAGESPSAPADRDGREPLDSPVRRRRSTDLRVDQPGDRDPGSSTDGSGSSADPETFRAFWGAVLAVDVGLLCVAVGPLLAYSWGWTYVGGLVFLVGLGAFYRAYAAYRDYVDDDQDDTSPEDSTEPDDPGEPVADDEEVGA